jgi:hypothetical protein
MIVGKISFVHSIKALWSGAQHQTRWSFTSRGGGTGVVVVTTWIVKLISREMVIMTSLPLFNSLAPNISYTCCIVQCSKLQT